MNRALIEQFKQVLAPQVKMCLNPGAEKELFAALCHYAAIVGALIPDDPLLMGRELTHQIRERRKELKTARSKGELRLPPPPKEPEPQPLTREALEKARGKE